MININLLMERFTELLKETFGERIYFIGLQGSFGRGEATERIDIDAVVILDRLTAPQKDLLEAVNTEEKAILNDCLAQKTALR